MEAAGIYIHVPFCKRKCPYCDFYSVQFDSELKDKYIEAICKDMLAYKDLNVKADTIYFGGGTPSLLNPKDIEKVINKAADAFSFSGEATMEANPDSATFDKLCDYKKAGINRISFGVQSFDKKELSALNRLHSGTQAQSAIENANKAGFDNISADIMLGIPYQTNKSLESTLSKLVSLPLNHVSAYMLKVEEETPFYKNDVLDKCPNEDDTADMYLYTVSFLESHGFFQYEISNFAKPKFESKHNLKYWELCPYIGFGAAAYSYFNGKRFYNKRDILDYIASNGKNTVCEEQDIDYLYEYIMLSLRLSKGLDLVKLKEFKDISYEDFIVKAQKYQKNKLLEITKDSIKLTKEGFLVSNYIILDFLEYKAKK